eukprot:gb/GECG01000874.1/.p1 GENE.gb/GECG01000874.1/~~gb/GECG01000874.1/.p1  ORF type:complete len:462 (+),score=56.54 gb/GECG01000874.1/:1-1386(+)
MVQHRQQWNALVCLVVGGCMHYVSAAAGVQETGGPGSRPGSGLHNMDHEKHKLVEEALQKSYRDKGPVFAAQDGSTRLSRQPKNEEASDYLDKVKPSNYEDFEDMEDVDEMGDMPEDYDEEDGLPMGDTDFEDEPFGVEDSVVEPKALPKGRKPIKIIRKDPTQSYYNGPTFGGPTEPQFDALQPLFAREPSAFSGPPALKELVGRCFVHTKFPYTYNFCPFKNITQQDKEKNSQVLLGLWKEWTSELSSSPVLPEQLYTDGQQCAIGHRATTVELKCGNVNSLDSVKEPRSCEYTATFSSPLACLKEGANSSGPSADTMCLDCRMRCHKALQGCTQSCHERPVCKYAESKVSSTSNVVQTTESSFMRASELLQKVKLSKDISSGNISATLVEDKLIDLISDLASLREDHSGISNTVTNTQNAGQQSTTGPNTAGEGSTSTNSQKEESSKDKPDSYRSLYK